MEATEMCFAATDENVATLLDRFRLMAGFVQSLVRLPGNLDLRLQYSSLNITCLYR